MVDKMMKYSFILLSGESEEFLKQLQELGVVDISRSTKPVSEESAVKFEKILKVNHAISLLESVDYSKEPIYSKIQEASAACAINGCKTGNTFSALARLEELKAEKDAKEKVLKAIEPWGVFSPESISDLKAKGVDLHFYSVPAKSYDKDWENIWPIHIVNSDKSAVWFAVPALRGEEYSFPIPETSFPEESYAETKADLDKLLEEEIQTKARLLCLKEHYLEYMKEGLVHKKAELDRMLASSQVQQAAEGHLLCFEGFAPVDEQSRLDEAFGKMGVFYVKEDAREEDNPPIKLKNNRFNRMFEGLTGMYGMPVYGEWDPTPVLAIFFLLFFAMCMGDAGYGLILIIYGILQDKKIVNFAMFDGLGKLISILGVATTIVGFFLGTAFGMDLTAASWMPQQMKDLMLSGDVTIGGSSYALQMVLAIGIGIFHICLAMTIKAVLYTKRFGLKANISTWGWLLLILGGIITGAFAMLGLLPENVTKIAVIAIGAVSALCIFIFNTPGRNPLINIGAGLWDTYNMATGIMGDVLSYIRLYALGLAGGMLGGAFNNLGLMVLGDNPTWQWLPFVLILLAGHALNLLMSCLGAFVHPLRLTFVEYFKNSGYEGKGAKYNPLKISNE